MQNSAVIVFLRAPQKGRVKTRLANHLDKGLVLDLYKAFVLDTLNTTRSFGNPLIFFTPKERERTVRSWLGDGYTFYSQAGADIGSRMSEAFARVFRAGVKKAILIGTDIPQLDKTIIARALEMLNSRDAVIGPSQDGGYYLAGFCRDRFLPQIFKGIDWSTRKVLEQTTTILEENRISFGRLPMLNDIDTIEDFNALVNGFNDGNHIGIHTKAILERYIRGGL